MDINKLKKEIYLQYANYLNTKGMAYELRQCMKTRQQLKSKREGLFKPMVDVEKSNSKKVFGGVKFSSILGKPGEEKEETKKKGSLAMIKKTIDDKQNVIVKNLQDKVLAKVRIVLIGPRLND